MTQSITEIENKILSKIEEEEVIGFLQKLVRIPSVNPPGDCRRVCQVCEEEIREAGIPVQVLAMKETTPCIVATIQGKARSPVLLFDAHMDTVPVNDSHRWKFPPFGADLVGDVVYGRGSADDKSNVAAQIMAAKALVKAKIELKGDLVVTIVSDEESGGFLGTKWLKDEGYLKPDWVVVGESTQNRVAIGERLVCWVELNVYGRSGHASWPDSGENAILKMAGVIQHLQCELAPQLAQRRCDFFPPSTLNISLIEGGTRINMIPDSCIVKIDCRIHPGESPESLLGAIRHQLELYSASVDPIKYDLNFKAFGKKAVATDPQNPLITTLQKSLESVYGRFCPLTPYYQGSDGRHFAHEGLPVAIFGPGDPMIGHSVDEYVSIHQLLKATEVLALTAYHLLA